MISRIQLSGPTKLVNDIKSTIDEEGLVQQHRIAETEAEKIISLAHAQGMEVEMSSPRATAKGVKKSRPTSLREHYMDTKEIWIMKPAANRTLQKLHRELDALKSEKSELEGALKAQLGAASLSLRWTPGLGHICHVKGKDTDIVGSLRSVSSSRSTKSFYESKWTALGQRIDQAKVRIQAEEQQVFLRLRKEIVRNLAALRQNAAVLDELDVASSLATLAEEQNLVRPILNNSTAHKIINGRHPTVQGGLRQQGRNFVANNCFVGDQEDIWLITGPNMGGKSTFLRQNALVTILAQMGSYVPADYAEIGIVDRVFSRVGSADSLYHDQSTFMVEMLETASILRNATSRSFVIMDEIGRGTTPTDGVAVAYAALHHLYHTNRCRTLFATHFHSLADLSRDMPRVGYYCTDVVDDGKGGFSFVHKLKQGINRESHALKVAQLAGMPESALAVARHMVQQGIEGRG
jgi:DNA mismatch repair ATPase MutS